MSLSHSSSSSSSNDGASGVDDVHSTSSLMIQGDRFYDETPSSRSGSRHSRRSTKSKRQEERRKKRQGIYGSEGDLLFKGLVVSLLVMIGTAAGFVFLFGLIQGDLETTEKVRRLMWACAVLCGL